MDVYVEIGKRRAFAGALAWPGWCRSGREEESALRALCDYGARYADALRSTGLDFDPPADVSAFNVIERLEGDATTDFGAPGQVPGYDQRPLDQAALQRLQDVLRACWRAFDEAARAAVGKELRKGPRGGGREREGVVQHVLGADASYLRQLGWKFKQDEGASLDQELDRTRAAILEGLAAAARGELPARGPRGGVRWTPRYFIRRSAWHVLDHAWELEDRVL